MKNQPRSNWTGWGMEWTADVTPIAAMVWLIRNNGQGKDTKGNPVQVPLFGLYRQLQSELWPEDDHHEWSDLMLRTMVAERITAVQGGKDSSKTHTMAKFALTDYLCFPEQTLSLMSSTDLRGLELRVWGDLKDLFTRARDKWPEIPGHPVDHMHGIFTDDLSEERDIRDIRKGLLCIPMLESGGSWKGLEKYTGIKQKRRRLFGDECFPAGTLVDTPNGRRRIEDIRSGDEVINASGVGRVVGVRRSRATRLVRMVMRDGRTVICTPDHPFMTRQGWEKSCEICQGQFIIGPYEAMQAMRETHLEQNLLQRALLGSLDDRNARGTEADLYKGTSGKDQSVCSESYAHRQSNEARRMSVEGECILEKNGVEAESSRRQWYRTNKSRVLIAIDSQWLRLELRNKNWEVERQRISSDVQSGRCFSRIETGGGGGWSDAQQSRQAYARRQENRFLTGSWVDRVEILQPCHFGGYGGDETGVDVYNLHVERHHSYSVMGLLVKNCQFMQPPYLTALANLNKGNFKGVFVGNPIGEGDPLDKLAEPLEGWDSLPEVTKTSIWKNRMGGTTINLVGSDSPAIRHPGKYPYLIDQSDIDYIVGYWGRDSAEYWNQAEGVRRPGVSLRRVVTRDMVNKFGAQDEVVWSVKPTIKGYAIDASYGGDRCIGGPFEFGADINGHQVISFGNPKVIPIKLYPKNTPEDQRILPEDQIAEYAKADCEGLSIPSANVFHDATGRGSLGSAFARLWRHDTNPIEFGGSATPRPVLSDLFIYDEKLKQKRLKRCDEHYSKFVSELWFSVRYVIEGRQSRNLPNEAVDELCAREWKRVRGDRIEVESKEDMKPRFGRSPDIGDWVSIAVEGARRLGFQITRMGWELPKQEKDEKWKEELRERARKSKQAYSLTYR